MIKFTLSIKYMGYVNFANNNRRVIKFLALWHLFLLAVSYNEKCFSTIVKMPETKTSNSA